VVDLIFPNTCVSCNLKAAPTKDIFCFACKCEILNTDHFETTDNELLFRLSGRVSVKHGAALYSFIKLGHVQKAIHRLKYGRRGDIGKTLGREFGKKMLNSDLFLKPDIIIPIPIHPKRERKRGYNQSKLFGEGIADVIDSQVSTRHLIKRKHITSQTSKLRTDRFKNVLLSFELKRSEELKGKSILLIDDVLTTGATIEAAIQKLSQIPNITIQLGLIALAND